MWLYYNIIMMYFKNMYYINMVLDIINYNIYYINNKRKFDILAI